jgi:signal transduction histidine kinase
MEMAGEFGRMRGACKLLEPSRDSPHGAPSEHPRMLEEFIHSHRDDIIGQAQARVASRESPNVRGLELKRVIPVFLDQLSDALRLMRSTGEVDHTQIGKTAGQHGHELFRAGLTIGQAVHDYGDVCQTITTLALETAAPISGEDFKMLNLCLDDAIAGAVTEYAHQREKAITAEGTERLGSLAHELRTQLNTAMLSSENIRAGRVAPGGSTGILLDRSLMALRSLIDRSLADVRLDAGLGRLELLSVRELLQRAEIGALAQGDEAQIQFLSATVDREVMVEGDREALAAAISNLLQNAFKFTRRHGRVSLTVKADDSQVLIEVEDECGGLPPGKTEDLFRAFEQRGRDRSGLGLGLAICLKAAKANAGDIRVKDVPGKGCVFTLVLPRKSPPALG